jgi:hypothetical protein
MRSVDGWCVAALLSAVGVAPAGSAAQQPRWVHTNRAAQAEALANDRRTVEVLLAARLGRSAAVAESVDRLGGRVKVRVDTVGYLRAELPASAVDALARSMDVEALNVGWASSVNASAGGSLGVSAESIQVKPPGPDTPAENAFMPTRDIGAVQFVRSHPTYDGRGVTIALLETVDLAHPALQRALNRAGKPTRKVAGLYAASLPGDPGDDVVRLPMSDTIRTVAKALIYNGTRFRAPRDGVFRIGRYDRRVWPIFSRARYLNWPWPFPTQVDGDSVLRSALDARPDDNYLSMLWDERAGRMWVDTNHDGSFADESPLTDYNTDGGYVLLGRRDAQAYDTRLHLALTTDTVRHELFVWMGGTPHGTAVAGVAAGNRLYGAGATGVAPSARVVAVVGPVIEGFIAAAQRPDVDLITSQAAYEMRLHDGSSVTSRILSRLVALYGKPIFASNDNQGPGISSPGEGALGERIVAVGGTISRDTWRALFGEGAPRAMSVINLSARGPRADGGMNPTVVAPACAALPWPSVNYPWAERESRGVFVPPHGYGVNCGTSYAAPMAAGAAALLISAAKQSGVPYDAASLREALVATARSIPGYTVADQGAGLIDVARAWDYLRAHASAHRNPSVAIEVSAPVRTVVSRELIRPNTGTGLYERDGWAAGDTGTRVITLTRRTGPGDAQRFNVRWVVNDGTFGSAPTITLPPQTPVPLSVRINPRTTGAHSSYVELVDPATRGVAQRVVTTVIAAEQLAGAPSQQLAHRGLVPWLGSASTFISVPRGTRRLDVTLVVGGPGRLQLRYYDPTGSRFPSTGAAPDSATVPCDTVTRCYHTGDLHRVIPQPEPGTWEIMVLNEDTKDSARRFRPEPPAPYTLTVGLDRAPEPWEGDGRHRVERLAFDSASGMATREIAIDSGTAHLAVRIGNPSDSAAQVDLYLFDCTDVGPPRCKRVTSAPYAGADKTLIVENPRAGVWKVVLDPFRLPRGSVELDYAVVTQSALVAPGVGGKPPERRGPN